MQFWFCRFLTGWALNVWAENCVIVCVYISSFMHRTVPVLPTTVVSCQRAKGLIKMWCSSMILSNVGVILAVLIFMKIFQCIHIEVVHSSCILRMCRCWSEPESCWKLCSRRYHYEEFQSSACLEPSWSVPWIQERTNGCPAIHG